VFKETLTLPLVGCIRVSSSRQRTLDTRDLAGPDGLIQLIISFCLKLANEDKCPAAHKEQYSDAHPEQDAPNAGFVPIWFYRLCHAYSGQSEHSIRGKVNTDSVFI